RADLARHITFVEPHAGGHGHQLLAVPSRERLERALRYVLDETEFLSPFGVRALSRYHLEHPFVLRADGMERRISYVPGEGTSNLFGGNSNWRGPIWFPVNYLLLEALQRYHHFYGDDFKIECPVGSGRRLNLHQVAQELAGRLCRPFLPEENVGRP